MALRAALNVISGLTGDPRPTNPIVWPGNGTTTDLNRFIAETPNPVTLCGWTGAVGLPVIAMMPEPITSMSSTITRQDGSSIPTCGLYSGNTTGTPQAILAGDNATTIIPRDVLSPGVYTVTVNTQARTVTWSFTVDPAAGDITPPATTAAPFGQPSGLASVAPFRFLDSRSSQRSTRLLPGVPKRIHVGGQAGIPANATAIQANITALHPTTGNNTYLTVYPCTTIMPTVSTVNFGDDGAVANGGIFPLQDGTGDLCFYTPDGSDYIVDISGYYTASSGDRFTPRAQPERLADTRQPGGTTGSQPLAAGGTLEVFTGTGSHTLSIVAVNAAEYGYLTVYPCDMPMPVASNLNYTAGETRSNIAVVPASADGRVCVYSYGSTHIVIDRYGSYQNTSGSLAQLTTPFRLIDTRSRYQPEMWLTATNEALPGYHTVPVQVAGIRGIPAGINTVFVNLTIAGADSDGWALIAPCSTGGSVSTINFGAGAARANAAAVPVPASGQVCVTTQTRAHVIIDVTGWAI